MLWPLQGTPAAIRTPFTLAAALLAQHTQTHLCLPDCSCYLLVVDLPQLLKLGQEGLLLLCKAGVVLRCGYCQL